MADHAAVERGTISIHTENIFPIIKKWLYSEKEIFLRELVANGVDAISKLQHINLVEGLGLAEEFEVAIGVDKDAGVLFIRDNGLGMTAEEIRKYINQIAFSSAEEFIHKFEELKDKNQLIGHFGLGFYSAFMVARKVEIRSLSYQPGARGAHWSCDGTTSYELKEVELPARGTEIVLHLEEDEKEFLEETRLRELIKRYCNFLPIAIRIGGEIVNDRNPLWTKTVSEVSEEEYREFYRKLYPFADEPLFWIHLNVDYPFNLKGILYFPKLTTEFDVSRSHIKLFCNQVFVSDNCPELIPEFLLPLQGCLDAPDLPLNVSRSYLQNEPQVRKIREVIAARVAAKIADLAKKEREAFGAVWADIHTFVKYGMMRDDKFFDKVKDHVIYRTTHESGYTTLPEYLERAAATHAEQVYYASDEAVQAPYLKLLRQQGLEVVFLDALIDSHFIQFLEMKEHKVKFQRVDADVSSALLAEDKSVELVEGSDGRTLEEKIRSTFEKYLGTKGLSVRVESLKDAALPGMVLLSEQMRRFKEMTRMIGNKEGADLFGEHTLLVNSSSPIVRNLERLEEAGEGEKAQLLAHQVYDLAMLSHQNFDKERMEAFLERSARVLELLSARG
jgi:molecular chaperone HtpG